MGILNFVQNAHSFISPLWGTERSVNESVGLKMGERFVFQRVRRVWLK